MRSLYTSARQLQGGSLEAPCTLRLPATGGAHAGNRTLVSEAYLKVEDTDC